MYGQGTRIIVKRTIKLGDAEFEPGLKGTILGSVNKMVGKAYMIRFDDDRTAELHVVIINNQTRTLSEGDEKENINPYLDNK